MHRSAPGPEIYGGKRVAHLIGFHPKVLAVRYIVAPALNGTVMEASASVAVAGCDLRHPRGNLWYRAALMPIAQRDSAHSRRLIQGLVGATRTRPIHKNSYAGAGELRRGVLRVRQNQHVSIVEDPPLRFRPCIDKSAVRVQDKWLARVVIVGPTHAQFSRTPPLRDARKTSGVRNKRVEYPPFLLKVFGVGRTRGNMHPDPATLSTGHGFAFFLALKNIDVTPQIQRRDDPGGRAGLLTQVHPVPVDHGRTG